MSFVDAALAPPRKTGQIKLHNAEAFAGMRKAGQLVAQCLDMLSAEVATGLLMTTRWITAPCPPR
jgi:methionyl aminopeptidase